ncbi:Zinc finger AN1 and C2H2 domain-containing stress-associated protein 13 [Ananas comosus]|uniref:Zinc finger AN1 and C2H2 domain-containing stress-associated protein 13 n=1 Tax=Ananas comosus TaxID=4615 RepID=A0A199V8B8_ANACO|nr:Zinc finger AN1 and C2H2 domain-containing stress-associated protein 13 [Ananas comosus]
MYCRVGSTTAYSPRPAASPVPPPHGAVVALVPLPRPTKKKRGNEGESRRIVSSIFVSLLFVIRISTRALRAEFAPMGTPEFPDLGKHCSVDDCKQIDFLPFTCDRCSQQKIRGEGGVKKQRS